jgi:hypothetical protein
VSDVVGRSIRHAASLLWLVRRYGEKIVKGSAFPRSYYKCSYQGCPAKKIIEKNETGAPNAEYKVPAAAAGLQRPPGLTRFCMRAGRVSTTTPHLMPARVSSASPNQPWSSQR